MDLLRKYTAFDKNIILALLSQQTCRNLQSSPKMFWKNLI